MTILKKIAAFFMLFALATVAFTQEAKNALLIANGDYPDEIGDLPKPIPEAEALKSALESIGFSVTLVKDADKETMVKALRQFKKEVGQSHGIAFFHYGGHAVQIKRINYLIPVHTNIEDEDQVEFRCVELDEVMQSMSGKSNVVILDSCRNNPFGKSRGTENRGLAAVSKKPANSIIIYSADSGQTAQDGVFTPILTKKIIEKDKSIYDVYKEVAKEVTKEVQEKTGNPQRPAVYIQLDEGEDIFLAGGSSSVKTLTGSLLINSEYAGIVFIDGEQKGAIKEDGSILIENLHTGSYTIEVKSDMNSFKEKVKITADKPASISIKTGSIKLSSEVAGKVYLNGKYYQDIGSSGVILFARLLEGNYHIEVRTESQTFKQEATVRVGEIATVAMYKPEEPVKKVQPEVKTQPAAKKDSMYENSYKPEEPIVKPVSSKTDTYSDNDDFYAFGYYGSYNLGILPVYKQSDTTTTSQSSYGITEEKPLLNHGFSAGFTWARFYLGSLVDFQLCTGYTFYYHSFGNEESITHHEFDAFGFKIGFGSNRIKFHLILVQLYSHWEEVRYASIQGSDHTTGTARFGIAPGCDLEFVINNYFSMYAAYNGRITLSGPLAIKHSCNIGLNINVVKVRM